MALQGEGDTDDTDNLPRHGEADRPWRGFTHTEHEKTQDCPAVLGDAMHSNPTQWDQTLDNRMVPTRGRGDAAPGSGYNAPAGGAPAGGTAPRTPNMETLRDVLRRTWGYDGFRPLQQEAMGSVLEDRDTLLVLPTGGGKSLCYQAPAVCRDGVALVVSPLISLMKDQVDDLRACGVAAACLNSSLGREESRRVVSDLRSGRLDLLYVAPERLVMEGTLSLLERARLSFIAIDEAHCISQWGHDFRPDYRGLGALRDRFPGVALHGFTATATPRVREDIVEQLGLREPRVLVGSFDRPNLHYRVLPRQTLLDQVLSVAGRHPGESGIVYCITRAEVERLAGALARQGLEARPYHAGLSDGERRRNQEDFIQDRAAIVVATVAFGMGIDKPDVRYVIHASMPSSIEAYQQQSGRAGRDGEPAECWLYHSGGDFLMWKRLFETGNEEARPGAEEALQRMMRFCTSMDCRHRALVRHFGQDLPPGPCGACDVCCGEVALVDDPFTVGQKILSCVLRLRQGFGADYTAKVLTGSRQRNLLERGHDRLSTYGLLAAEGYSNVRDWIEQLVGQGFARKAGEYNCLEVTPTGRQLLRGELVPRLSRPRPVKTGAGRAPRRSALEEPELTSKEQAIFDALRALRRDRARELAVPPYVVFSDAALRDMARRRPATPEAFLAVHGVGQRKLADHGQEFLACIRRACERLGLETSSTGTVVTGMRAVGGGEPGSPPAAATVPEGAETCSGVIRSAAPRESRTSPARSARSAREMAFELFGDGASLEQVVEATGRRLSTVEQYLADFFEETARTDPSPWIDADTAARAAEALRATGTGRLRPAFDHLGGSVSYLALRVVRSCLHHQDGPVST